MAVEIPHFALPLRLAAGRPVVNEQDSTADVLACVEAILRYRKGSRPEEPEFGIDDPVFTEGDLDLDALATEIEEWEPRASAVLTEDRDQFDAALRRVGVAIETGE